MVFSCSENENYIKNILDPLGGNITVSAQNGQFEAQIVLIFVILTHKQKLVASW